MNRIAAAAGLAFLMTAPSAAGAGEPAAGIEAGHASTPAALEGGPAPSDASPLQDRVNRAAPGETIEVGPGTWRGDLLIDRPVTLLGRGRPLLLGSGHGSVVRVRADGVVLEGLDIDGGGDGDLGKDTSGIHVAAARVTVRDCRIRGTLFGIYLREAAEAVVEGCSIHGIKEKLPGEKGSGIHIWNTQGFRCERNVITDARDGFYIQSSSGGRITGNTVRDVRYGLHFMFSDDNVFEDNLFENGAAGTAIMYSRRIVFARNRFLRNRGFASVGLLFKSCEDVAAHDNLIADNARGIFLEGTSRALFERNVVAGSDAAIVLYDSCSAVSFRGNLFTGNMTPLMLVGKRTDTSFDGNYWSDNEEPDLDGDGRSDRPYRLQSVFDHLRGNLLAADLFSRALAASALAAAEKSFPVLSPVSAVDRSPLARAPVLRDVPAAAGASRGRTLSGLAASLAVLVAGATIIGLGGRRRA